MKTHLLTLFSALYLSAASQWTLVDTLHAQYKQIYFYDQQTGFVSSGNFYKKTTDGGQSWVTIPTDYDYQYNFYFLNRDTGFSRLGKTYDGGITWNSLGNFSTPFCFTKDNQYGYSTQYIPFGYPSPIFKSSDRGESWVQKTDIVPDIDGLNTGAMGISFSDSLNGYIVAGEGHIYRTNNGGSTWTLTWPLGKQYDMNGVFMVDSLTAFVYGWINDVPPFSTASDKILRTTDGGVSWQTTDIPMRTNRDPVKFQFFGNQNGYFCDGNYFKSTRDGGITWVDDTTVHGVVDFSFVDAHTVFLLTWDSIVRNGMVAKKYLINGMDETKANVSDINVMPNPFSNQLTFSLAPNEKATVSLYNFLGQQILQQTFANATTINTEQFAAGIYFYELRNNKGVIKTDKVMKQ